ncbi:MAG: cytochrome P450 [Acidimicrobiia bacterium]
MIDTADISLEDLERDPHPILAELRAAQPVAYVPNLEMWLVTRWDDVVFVCEHPELFTANTDPSWLRECLGENMLTLDGPHHDRLAGGMRGPFAGREAGRGLRERLPSIFDRLIDDFVADGAADLMTAYAEPLANITLLEALGFRQVTWQQLAGWCHGVITGLANFENDPDKTAIAARAHGELGEALRQQLDEFEERPDALGLSHYLAAGFTRDEIVNNVRLMISGGINEPRDGVGLVMYMLLTEPGLIEVVQTDRSLLRKVVEETFRFHTPVGTATRQTTRDVELGGVTIPAGSIVAGVLTAANRDPARWTDPDMFSIERGEGAHLAFSVGEHRCLGEWIGRQQVRIGVERLLDRLPGLHLTGDVSLYGFEFRGPTSLPVAWG